MNKIDTPFYDYDFGKPLTKRVKSKRKDRKEELAYYNPINKKWVTKMTKSKPLERWISNGSNIKYIYIPKRLSDLRIDRTGKIIKVLDIADYTPDSTDIKVVMHVIFSRSFYSDEFGYSPIYCRKFSDLLGQKYHTVLDYCSSRNWISINPFFKFNTEQAHSKTYKINNYLLPNNDIFKFRKIALDDVKITNKLQARTKSFNDSEKIKETHKILAEIARKAKIDLEGFKLEVSNNPEVFKNKKLDLAFYLIEQINSGDISIKETLDTFGERFFSGFCNIISEVRKHIYFNSVNEKLVEVDFSNSQMYFFSLLSNKKFYTEVLFNNTYNSTEKGKFNELHHQLQLVKNNPDFIQFCNDAVAGKVYDNVANRTKDWDRNKAKEMMMKILFARRGQYKKAKRHISKVYPSMVEVIEKMAYGINATTISMACQRAESNVLLDRICQKLYHEHGVKKFLTVHDSILSTKKNTDIIIQCIQDEFISLDVTPPNLKSGK